MNMMGVGLTAAILFDATIVRMWLVPSTVEHLGDRSWWLRHWLDRLLPDLDVEGRTDDRWRTSRALLRMSSRLGEVDRCP